MNRPAFDPVALVVRAAPDNASRELVRRRVSRALKDAPEPVLAARVNCEFVPPRASVGGRAAVLLHCHLDLNGRLLHLRVGGPTLDAAVTSLEHDLRRRLHESARHWEARRGRTVHAPTTVPAHGTPAADPRP